MMSKKHDRSTIGAVGIMIGGAPLQLVTALFRGFPCAACPSSEEVSDIWSYG